jgi:aryl-alcohol dehydrogenase-like predicted oxidoreductase
MKLNEYTTLGRTGLRVSPLCLGTMTFGTEWGWGAEEKTSQQLFDHYIDAGGNFVDTADAYTGGHSEEMVGKFIADRNLRDGVVLATKFTFNAQAGNPNSGGNGRKNIYRALDASLRRLKTDYIDLYYLHAWDVVTPVEEVVSTLTDLVRTGKIRYYGLSDTPAWYVARAQTIAEKDSLERVATLQLEYSLVERNIEREHIPVSQELGIGICPWSPLAGGFLTGKYRREGNTFEGQGRLEKQRAAGSQLLRNVTEKYWKVLDVLLDVSSKLGRSPAQVALNWSATQPGATSSIFGANSLAHLKDNLGAAEFDIPAELRDRLNKAGAIETIHPYTFYAPHIRAMISGGTSIKAWSPSQLYPKTESTTLPTPSVKTRAASD